MLKNSAKSSQNKLKSTTLRHWNFWKPKIRRKTWKKPERKDTLLTTQKLFKRLQASHEIPEDRRLWENNFKQLGGEKKTVTLQFYIHWEYYSQMMME